MIAIIIATVIGRRNKLCYAYNSVGGLKLFCLKGFEKIVHRDPSRNHPFRSLFAQGANHHRPIMPKLELPVANKLGGRWISIEDPETTVSLQRVPVTHGENGAKEEWVLKGLDSKFRAQAYAAINRNGCAVTDPWLLQNGEFTLVICSGKDGLTGFFYTQDDFVRLCAAQLNIKSMPNNSEEEVVSVKKLLLHTKCCSSASE